MLKAGSSRIIVIIVVSTLCTCIDPYTPKLRGYESLLVVDGLITNSNSEYTVKLSKTFQEQNANPIMVSDATVSVKDDNGNISYLKNRGDGIYKTDSTEFIGITGRTYVLNILTTENEEYESEPCLMQPVPDIDSIYFTKDQEVVNNGTVNQEGIRIYLDSKQGDNSLFYRWTYDETWEFRVPNPKQFDYIKTSNPNGPDISPVADVKEFCWKNRRSGEILIRSVSEGQTRKIEKIPIYFIATNVSDRLLIQYSILVKQYSISQKEYVFWNNLKQVNETSGDIFARTPYAVISNIHNTKNPNERVLGFFQVSSVSQKRKNIFYRDVALMDLPFYSYNCKTWQFSPADFTGPAGPPKTWDDVYWYLSIVSDYTFIKPIYSGLGSTDLVQLEFSRPECTNCELYGTHTKPDFLVE